jgi:hypothetical protein
MAIHSIVLAVNNPPRGEVDAVVGMHLGGGWKAVWCDDPSALAGLLPQPPGGIRYLVVGTSGSVTKDSLMPYLCPDLRDVAAFGAGAQALGVRV